MEPNPAEISVSTSTLETELQNTKICAVMVTYNPDSSLEQNIRALLPHVDKLIIVDNGSELPIRAHIDTIASSCQIEVIWNKQNLGLATALNIGVRSALGSGNYFWIVTFDQDSQVSSGFRDAMLEAYTACPYRDRVGIIGPHHVLFHESASTDNLKGVAKSLFCEATWVMQSGTFVSADIFHKIGFFDDSFFIDYVDIDFCLRLRKCGLRIIQARQAVVHHRLGDPSRHTIFGKTTTVYVHSELRRYYAARNRLRIYKRYLISDPRYIGHDAWSWFKEIVKLVLFEKNRGRKLSFIARGIWDALRGRNGMYAQSAK